MIIPSFTGFAATPNTAQAYLGGVASSQKDRQIGLEEQEMAQRAITASQAIQMKQQELQAEQQRNAMQADIAREQLEKKTMIDQQRINIDQQYKEQVTGLQAEKLKTAHQTIQLKVQEAAQKFQAQQNFQLTREAMIKSGMSESDATAQAARQWFPQMGMNGSAMSGAMKAQATMPEIKATPVPGAEGYASVPTRAGQVQLIDLRKGEQAQQRIENQQSNAAARADHVKFNDLIKVQDNDSAGRIAAIKAARGSKMTDKEKESAKAFGNRAAEIQKLTGGEKTTAPAAEKVDSADEVVKLYKGRRAVFNKSTKEFIRYE